MRKLSQFIFIAGFLSFTIISNAQIKVTTEGNSGFGVSNPVAKVEIQDQQYLLFSATDQQSGILFYETYGKTATSVTYGAFIEYDEISDVLNLGTYQAGTKNIGMLFRRDNAHIGIGSKNNSWTYELRVDDDLEVLDRLLVGGDAWVHGSEIVTSDISMKTNISSLESKDVLNKLIQLNGKSYHYKPKGELESHFQKNKLLSDESSSEETDSSENHIYNDMPNFPQGTQYGLIAQEVKELFPEAVRYDEELQLYGINYNSIIPLLIEAIKEQQNVITNLQSEVGALGRKLEFSKGSDKKSILSNVESGTSVANCRLYQNKPNPFDENTVINYYLQEGFSSASIYIYDMTGKQLKSIPLLSVGESSIEISGNDLQPGMFFYTMIVNGIVIDTKQMILTR